MRGDSESQRRVPRLALGLRGWGGQQRGQGRAEGSLSEQSQISSAELKLPEILVSLLLEQRKKSRVAQATLSHKEKGYEV